METLENQIWSLIIESLNLEGMSPEEIADSPKSITGKYLRPLK